MIAVLINNRDRPTELFGLLQSLRTQTEQRFDIYILDDCSGTIPEQYYFIQHMISRLKQEGHNLFIRRTNFVLGVSRARQEIVDWAMERDYQYFLRVDDDTILQPDYIERLMKLMDKYDIATGVTIPFQPTFKRESKFVKIANRVILKDGIFILNSDDCGGAYTDEKIVDAHHFRSCALMKRKVHEEVKYYPTKLSNNGFREEQIFSFKALLKGFKIGCDLKAENYHLMTPSGGERDTMNMVPFNQKVLEDFTKENEKELSEIFGYEELGLELNKENNLISR